MGRGGCGSKNAHTHIQAKMTRTVCLTPRLHMTDSTPNINPNINPNIVLTHHAALAETQLRIGRDPAAQADSLHTPHTISSRLSGSSMAVTAFSHQNTTSKPCLVRPRRSASTFGRFTYRVPCLRWHVTRARGWVTQTARSRLVGREVQGMQRAAPP